MIVQDELKNHFRDTHLIPRTKESYDAQAEIVERMPEMAGVYGLKRNSVCNQLRYFHVVNGQPPDIAHDLFEGVAPDVMERVILHCVTEGYFSLQFLNDQVESFPFEGFDKTNKPSRMATQISKFKVKQKAVQTWCFLRLLPLIVGDKVPVDDDLWDLLLLLADIVEICTASQVNAVLCEFLADLIESFLDTYFRHFPDVSMKPKFHYLVHYPKLMLHFGPLVHCWTLRYEGKHMYFKESNHVDGVSMAFDCEILLTGKCSSKDLPHGLTHIKSLQKFCLVCLKSLKQHPSQRHAMLMNICKVHSDQLKILVS